MLSREVILSGAYLKAFENLPGPKPWNPERIRASIDSTLAARPDTGPTWMFAYGSLMWNPMLDVERQELATLHGWHRSFCLNIAVGRASRLTPGRMLALEEGGATQGVALQLATRNLDEDLLVV